METPNRWFTERSELMGRVVDVANQEGKERRIEIIAELMKDFELTLTDIGEIAREFVDRGWHSQ